MGSSDYPFNFQKRLEGYSVGPSIGYRYVRIRLDGYPRMETPSTASIAVIPEARLKDSWWLEEVWLMRVWAILSAAC
jgi:hypothetical protein